MRPSKSKSIFVKHNPTTNISTSIHVLFSTETVITTLCLHISLMVYMYKDILYYSYEGIYTVVHLLLSLPVSLRRRILRPSLFMSLQSKFLQSSVLTSLWNGSLRLFLLTSLPSLLVSMRNGVMQSSLLVSLRSSFVPASPMTSLWKIFLCRLYEYMSTVAPIQVIPETNKLWVLSHSSLQPYMK